MKQELDRKPIGFHKFWRTVGMGAIVCCVDCSGSMRGDCEIWAKALMGGLGEKHT